MLEEKKIELFQEGAIVKMTADMCKQYCSTLADFYFKNVKSCSFTEEFVYAQAVDKINELVSYIQQGKAFAFGYLVEDKLIGYIWGYLYKFREEQRIYINEIHVLEKWRSHGIGKFLLDEIEKEAKMHKIKALYIHAEADNEKAIKLYQKAGYKEERIQLRKGL